MFDVLAYVCENENFGEFGRGADHLVRQLNAVGFEADQIDQALTWLRGLHTAARELREPAPSGPPTQGLLRPSAQSVRIYPSFEQRHLGTQCLAFIAFLETGGALPAHVRELVLERAMAIPGAPLALEDLKLIVRMVYTNLEFDPGALVLGELASGSVRPTLH